MAKELIADRVGVTRRYVRSIEIERDFSDPNALEGYILTPTARDGLSRILSGLKPESSQRAFRITGPYGSGKSAFGLLVASLFDDSPKGKLANKIKEEGLGKVAVPKHHPVVLVGSRTSFSASLIDAITRSAKEQLSDSHKLVKKLCNFQKTRESNQQNVKEIIDLVSEYTELLFKKRKKRLLILVDEMGRFLEFAASNPNLEDPSIFQLLAERASGNIDSKLAVIVIMHQRFGDYVASMGEWMEDEWARTSERFEEIPFFETSEQTLYLLSQALNPTEKHDEELVDKSVSLYMQALKQNIFTTKTANLKEIAERMYPFHPVAIACLISASLRFGQNERSVFSFLQSSEPSGFQRFANETTYNDTNWYRISDLFDYFMSQGHFNFKSNDRDRRWQLAQDSLLVNSDLTEEQIGILKSIALISVLEPIPGLKADVDTISWMLGIGIATVEMSIQEFKSRGIVYERRTQGDFCLWSHSSVDLDFMFNEAKIAISKTLSSDSEFSNLSPMRPLVAQRHYHRTGNLRTFSVSYLTTETQSQDECEGKILIKLVYPEDSYEKCLKEAKEISKELGPMVLVKLQKISANHIDLNYNLNCWRWIGENCKELRIDDFARSEVDSKIQYFENLLKSSLASFVDVTNDSDNSDWIHNGKKRRFKSRYELIVRLSEICDEVYCDAPILRNELINRDKLSAPVSAARMRLMELMLENENIENFGIEGSPPEFSIYLSMFKSSDLHRFDDKRFKILALVKNDPMNWNPAWKKIDKMVGGESDITVQSVIEELKKPPIGLKSGPALLLVVAYFICNRKSTILMERNTYQPEVTPAHFLRLAKAPNKFILKHIQTTDQSEILHAIRDEVSIWDENLPNADVKSIVEGIYKWWGGLSQYAKSTQKITQEAQAVRSVLRKANEPIDLIFVQLPEACGLLKSGKITKNGYVIKLADALNEINDALPMVQSIAKKAVETAFGAKSIANLQKRINTDFKDHILEIANYELRSFVDRAMDENLSEDAWLDRIAGLIVGKRIDSWDDNHIDSFSYELRITAHKLNRLLFAIRKSRTENSPVCVVHLTDSNGNEGAIFSHREANVDKESLKKIRGLLKNANHRKALIVELVREYVKDVDMEKIK